MKGIQRFSAIILLFGIWMIIFYITKSLKQPQTLESIDIPNSTEAVLKLNSREVFSDILFDFSFKNSDPKILKIVGDYYRNSQQDTTKGKQFIDFTKNIAILKVRHRNDFIWILAGSYKQGDRKNNKGVVKDGVYYQCLEPRIRNSKKILSSLLKPSNAFKIRIDKFPIEYTLFENKKEKVSYRLDLNDKKLIIQYASKKEFLCVKVPDKTPCFHLSTTLNRGSLLPESYSNLKSISDNLSSFSINYYGAAFNEIDDESIIEFNFDLLLNFNAKISEHKLEKTLQTLMGSSADVHDNILTINKTQYIIKEINDSSIFIGQHKPKIVTSEIPFKMSGQPALITDIKNLGWKGGILEMIPEYRALKDFSNSVTYIDGTTKKGVHTVHVNFENGKNARLEVFRVLLTMANAYQFSN